MTLVRLGFFPNISQYFERQSQSWMASEPCGGHTTGE
jgi:hypothetical protein